MVNPFTTLQDVVGGVAQRPSDTAIIAFKKDGIQSYSFGELGNLARRLAYGLSKSGLEAGSRVVLFAPNQPEWILVCLALICARAVPVPIDAQISREDLETILRQSDARWACTTVSLASRLEVTGIRLKHILLDGEAEERPHWRRFVADSADGLTSASPDDLAVLFYTSGTSGQPKGVPLTHKNIASNLNALLGVGLIRPDDRVLVPLPLHHVYPFTIGMLAPLAAGVPIILPGGLTGKEFVRALQEGAATAVIGVPGGFRAFFITIKKAFINRPSPI
jgi:long-chain acyl-CoA synthetase